ncbi:hypothetical protein QBC35DRAFT_451066 [Podospora australis]|uniref:Uncharacterized protein n=1 Tax=Podospora australis TaxID=1536484 RepID=A0AAN6WWF7_9PEZI|nr:hypothetical protein QBC35DRAFT_451066 [Podospora australis]
MERSAARSHSHTDNPASPPRGPDIEYSNGSVVSDDDEYYVDDIDYDSFSEGFDGDDMISTGDENGNMDSGPIAECRERHEEASSVGFDTGLQGPGRYSNLATSTTVPESRIATEETASGLRTIAPHQASEMSTVGVFHQARFPLPTEIFQHELDLDWALIRVRAPESLRPNAFVNPKNPSVPVFISRIGEFQSDRNTPVYIVTSPSTPQTGILLPGTTFLGSINGSRPSNVWTLSLDENKVVAKGHSGAVVVDATTHEALGHIIGSNPLGQVYVSSYSAILEQIRRHYPERVANLPAPIDTLMQLLGDRIGSSRSKVSPNQSGSVRNDPSHGGPVSEEFLVPPELGREPKGPPSDDPKNASSSASQDSGTKYYHASAVAKPRVWLEPEDDRKSTKRQFASFAIIKYEPRERRDRLLVLPHDYQTLLRDSKISQILRNPNQILPRKPMRTYNFKVPKGLRGLYLQYGHDYLQNYKQSVPRQRPSPSTEHYVTYGGGSTSPEHTRTPPAKQDVTTSGLGVLTLPPSQQSETVIGTDLDDDNERSYDDWYVCRDGRWEKEILERFEKEWLEQGRLRREKEMRTWKQDRLELEIQIRVERERVEQEVEARLEQQTQEWHAGLEQVTERCEELKFPSERLANNRMKRRSRWSMGENGLRRRGLRSASRKWASNSSGLNKNIKRRLEPESRKQDARNP